VPPRLARLVARSAQRGAERAQALLRQELASREQHSSRSPRLFGRGALIRGTRRGSARRRDGPAAVAEQQAHPSVPLAASMTGSTISTVVS
jgi:hypothetical protein